MSAVPQPLAQQLPDPNVMAPGSASPVSPLIGSHVLEAGTAEVSFLEDGPGPGGPQYVIALPNGAVVTVVDDATVQAYLDDGSGVGGP